MKKVLLTVFALVASAESASAFELITGKDTPNVVVVDGLAYPIPLNQICGRSTFRAGAARYDLGRDGKYLTVGGLTSRIVCRTSVASGGGFSNNASSESQSDSQARSGETKPGETTGGATQGGKTDDGKDTGISAISG